MEKTSEQQGRNYYSKAQFWDERYQSGGYFDWYAEYPELQYCFETQYGMTKEDSILMVGCGNSKLSQQMFEAGYKNIVNIDISPTVIQQMQTLSPGMQWLVMDATNMTFEDKKFDYVVDKGTMDALIAGRDLSPTIKLLQECMRVTKQQGQVILITYGSPEGRKKVFESSYPFDLFDYYFTYINLNDMSTMINLMRNNSIGPKGEQIQKQEALQKSMKEFMMIKLMRARRQKDKQFVIWEQYSKFKQPVSSQDPKKKSQVSQQKASESQKVQQSDKKDETVQPNPNSDNIVYQSKPQKQSYVYAYSIKRKFGFDFDPSEFANLQVQKQYEGSQGLTNFEIRGSQNIHKSIAQSVEYCKKKQIAHSSVRYVAQGESFSNNQQSVKFNVSDSDAVYLNVLTKTNIDMKIIFEDFNHLNQGFKSLGNTLVQKMGLTFHPCPKTYALFTMLRGKMKAKSVNQLLKQYWYPTFTFTNIDIQKSEAYVVLSIPPVLSEYIELAKSHIAKHFGKWSSLKIEIESVRNGFVSFPQLSLFGVLNISSLSHNKGKGLVAYMEEFWNDKKQNCPSGQQSKLYIVKNTHVEIPQKLVPVVLLHVLTLYA